MIPRRTYLRRNRKPIARRTRPRQRKRGSRAEAIRQLAELWSWKVRERDGHRCQWPDGCGAIGTDAHHIYGKGSFRAVRFVLDNGITLCRVHHDQAHAHATAFLMRMQERMGARFDSLRGEALRAKASWDLGAIRVALEAA